MERLQEQYNKKIAPALKQKFGFKNVMQVPKVLKVVVNAGVGKAKEDKKKIDQIVEDIKKIAGQAPVRAKARKSIAGLKRSTWPIASTRLRILASLTISSASSTVTAIGFSISRCLFIFNSGMDVT